MDHVVSSRASRRRAASQFARVARVECAPHHVRTEASAERPLLALAKRPGPPALDCAPCPVLRGKPKRVCGVCRTGYRTARGTDVPYGVSRFTRERRSATIRTPDLGAGRRRRPDARLNAKVLEHPPRVSGTRGRGTRCASWHLGGAAGCRCCGAAGFPRSVKRKRLKYSLAFQMFSCKVRKGGYGVVRESDPGFRAKRKPAKGGG
eukprot:3407509-Prymnesium_polylepis.2